MKKTTFISIALALSLYGEDMGTIEVKAPVNSVEVENISGKDVRSPDLADALSKTLPSISMIRRSGIANDVVIRGLKKDNINVLIDGAKIYGACPNRMDPPISHVVTNSAQSAILQEGPYDVENFGSLGSTLNVNTLTPKKGINGDINANVGSFGYKQGSALIDGGNDTIKFLIGGSIEESDQYKDGNGDTLSEQVDKTVGANAPTAYQPSQKNRKAYEKKSALGKVVFNPNYNQEVKLGYMLNRSDDILYPSSPMDADYDDSNILTLGYSIYGNPNYLKELKIETYYSDVDHPMNNKYRNSGALNYATNHLKTKMYGGKIKNSFELGSGELGVGLDYSKRNWDGNFYSTNVATGAEGPKTKSMPDVDTVNQAIFATYDLPASKNLDLKFGARYDDSTVKANDKIVNSMKFGNFGPNTKTENDYNSLSGNMFATYTLSKNTKLFGGLGKASRVPDGKELYVTGGAANTPSGDLKQSDNYQGDIGIRYDSKLFGVRSKAFASSIKNFIIYNQTLAKYVNTDANIYGVELGGYYNFTDYLSFETTIAYTRGTKDALQNETDTNLPDIAPLKAISSLILAYGKHSAALDMTNSAKWSKYDSDNGEQEIPSYNVFDLSYNYKIGYGFDIGVGVDNIFDEEYAVSNTYSDLTLLTGTNTQKMLLNEPGRYFYANLRYKF
jgi:iron complex outermembrane receptor protein